MKGIDDDATNGIEMCIITCRRHGKLHAKMKMAK